MILYYYNLKRNANYKVNEHDCGNMQVLENYDLGLNF